MKLFDLINVELTVYGPLIVISYSAFEHGAVLAYDIDALRTAAEWGLDTPEPVVKFRSWADFESWRKGR